MKPVNTEAGIRGAHFKLTKLVNAYYRHHQTLPEFDKLDTMWFNVSEQISDAKTRVAVRKVSCAGYVRGPGCIGVILSVPKTFSPEDVEEDDE